MVVVACGSLSLDYTVWHEKNRRPLLLLLLLPSRKKNAAEKRRRIHARDVQTVGQQQFVDTDCLPGLLVFAAKMIITAVEDS